GCDEAAHEIAAHRPGADQEGAPQREREWGLRPSANRADPLPRALDPSLYGRLEAAPARYLEVGEAGPVEDLGKVELRGGREDRGERLLSEQANGRVDERRHG